MRKSFQAILEPREAGLSWTIARVPFDPAEVWAERKGLRVKGSIRAAGKSSENKDSVEFCTNLIRSQDHGYFLLVTGKMRKAAHLQAGSRVEISLEPDLDGRAATPPPELAKLFKSDRAVKKWFETLNYSLRKYIADSIAEPKSAEARVRRAEQWMERMMLTMEGEEHPPPILQMAFRRQPLARAGWDAMTPNQRRLTLLSIFSCVSPEAQAKRVERVMDEAVNKATKNIREPSNMDD
jgi:uncharacterized protein YdeI (YjbR/CyaY-like superfamily)